MAGELAPLGQGTAKNYGGLRRVDEGTWSKGPRGELFEPAWVPLAPALIRLESSAAAGFLPPYGELVAQPAVPQAIDFAEATAGYGGYGGFLHGSAAHVCRPRGAHWRAYHRSRVQPAVGRFRSSNLDQETGSLSL